MSDKIPAAIIVKRLVVRKDRILGDIHFGKEVPRETTPQLIDYVVTCFPRIPYHACVNGKGDTFATVMESTPLPHVIEHLVIDIQAQAEQNKIKLTGGHLTAAPVTFVGTSRWLDEELGHARVEVSFTEDLVALRAFKEAVEFLAQAVVISQHDFSTLNI